jgi:hypothetical protein
MLGLSVQQEARPASTILGWLSICGEKKVDAEVPVLVVYSDITDRTSMLTSLLQVAPISYLGLLAMVRRLNRVRRTRSIPVVQERRSEDGLTRRQG